VADAEAVSQQLGGERDECRIRWCDNQSAQCSGVVIHMHTAGRIVFCRRPATLAGQAEAETWSNSGRIVPVPVHVDAPSRLS